MNDIFGYILTYPGKQSRNFSLDDLVGGVVIEFLIEFFFDIVLELLFSVH